MSTESALLIIYADEVGHFPAESVGQILSAVGSQTINGLPAARESLLTRHTPPKYIIIDIGARASDVLSELDALAEVCESGVRVVVTGQLNDVSFYRALIQRGIIEYFAYPADAQQMADALLNSSASLSQIVAKSSKEAKNKNGFAVGFVSAASGDGASTVALNTAYLLAAKFNASVVLVDLDYQFGMVARHLDLKAPYGIRELLEYPERGVDASLVNKMLVPYGKNLKIIASPPDLRKLPNVRSEQMVELLNVLRSQFDYVIFDVQHIWADWIAGLLSKLDHNVLVAQLWLRSLTHVTRMLAAWNDAGINKKAVSLALNRSGAKFKEAMTAEDFERVSGMKIGFYLPNDTKSIVASENQGKALVEVGGSLLDKPLLDIAQHIHTLHTGELAVTQKENEKKSKFSFLSKKS
jgi:pilus assembly protein CpaE